jgi:hypothetical protein
VQAVRERSKMTSPYRDDGEAAMELENVRERDKENLGKATIPYLRWKERQQEEAPAAPGFFRALLSDWPAYAVVLGLAMTLASGWVLAWSEHSKRSHYEFELDRCQAEAQTSDRLDFSSISLATPEKRTRFAWRMKVGAKWRAFQLELENPLDTTKVDWFFSFTVDGETIIDKKGPR